MISNKKAIESAKVIADFCKEQVSCQNCIFRKHGADSWGCLICAFDIQDAISNYEAKRKNRGYI